MPLSKSSVCVGKDPHAMPSRSVSRHHRAADLAIFERQVLIQGTSRHTLTGMSRAHDCSVRRLLHKLVMPVAAAAIACGTVTAGVVGMPTPAAEAAVPGSVVPQNSSDITPLVHSNEDVPDGQLGLVVKPENRGELMPDGKLGVTVDIVNRSPEALPPSTITLNLSDAPIITRYTLEQWSEGQITDGVTTNRVLGEVPVEPLAAGATGRVRIDVDAAMLKLDTTSGFAPYALRATLAGDSAHAEGRSTLVWNPGPAAAPNRVATVVPITAPLGRTPFLTAPELASMTVEGGSLDLLLDAVDGTKATLAIDPRIPASIRVLGSKTPPEASAWLARLESLPNDSFALPYADVDRELLADSGLDVLPSPDLSLLADPESFASPEDGNEPQPKPSPSEASASPSVSPTSASATPTANAETPAPPASSKIPSNEELRAVKTTLNGVAWPAANSLDAGDLERLRAEGSTTVLLDGDNVTLDEEASWTPSSASSIEGMDARVMDDSLARAVARAVQARDEASWSAAAAEVSTILAVTARELPQSPRTLLTATPRVLPEHPEFVGKTLRLLDELTWSDAASFAETAPGANGQDPVAGSIAPAPVDQVRVERVRELMRSLDQARGYSTMYDDAHAFVADLEAATSSALAVGWRRDRGEWLGATQNILNYVLSSEHAVVVVPTSDIQLVGTEAALPVFVQNLGTRRVTVQVEFVPKSSLLKAGTPQTITIEPGSMTRAHLSVTAIANGLTTGEVVLKTSDGKQISTPQQLNVNVRAELEAVGIGIILAVIAVLLIAGTVRTIRRRKQGAAASSPGEDDESSRAEADGEDPRADTSTANGATTSDGSETRAHTASAPGDEPSETER